MNPRLPTRQSGFEQAVGYVKDRLDRGPSATKASGRRPFAALREVDFEQPPDLKVADAIDLVDADAVMDISRLGARLGFLVPSVWPS